MPMHYEEALGGSSPYAATPAPPPGLSIPTPDSPYGGIGGALSRIFGTQLEQQRRREVQQFFDDIRNSGSRDKALEVVKNYSHKFVNTRDFDTAFRMVDETWPEASKEVRQVTVYDEDTGEAAPHFVRSSETPLLASPEEVKKRFGQKATLVKPDLETFYSQPDKEGRVHVLGKLPVSQRPEGAVTLPELTEARRTRGEERAESRAEEQKRQFNERMDLAERRFGELLGRLGETDADKALMRGRQLINDAARMSVLELGGKVLPDGTFAFDDSNRAALHNKRLDAMRNIAETNPSILTKATGALELHSKATKMYPSPAETPTPTPTPTPKKPGFISELFGGGRGQPAPKAAPKGKQPVASSGAPTVENAKKQVEAAGWEYKPDIYEYRTNPKTDRLQRRRK